MRLRYWRLAAEDVLEATYPPEKANHWEIKCMQGEYQHFGVFWYRYGTPFDKEPVHGICFYYNEIPDEATQKLTDFLKNKFGGTPVRRKTRVFFQGSQEFADAKSIGKLWAPPVPKKVALAASQFVGSSVVVVVLAPTIGQVIVAEDSPGA